MLAERPLGVRAGGVELLGGCRNLHTELPLAALAMAVFLCDERLGELVHHSDRGSQDTSVRDTERLDGFDARPSLGSHRDSHVSALAETTIGLAKTELVGGGRGPAGCRSSEEPLPRSIGTPTVAPAEPATTRLRRSSRRPTIATATGPARIPTESPSRSARSTFRLVWRGRIASSPH